MARSGMVNLVARLRRLVDDTSGDVWADDELIETLDAHKLEVRREPLEFDMTRTSGTSYIYTDYRSRYGNFEEGTAYFKVEDSAGAARGTADYTVNYVTGAVTMTADQKGTALYLTGWSYDLNGAAADCWRERASTKASLYDFSADGNHMSRSQWFKQCREIANDFAMKARPVTVRRWTVGEFRDE